VFGCGGDRDRTKRARMGKVAVELADWVIVTSDNPRTEDPNAIIDEVMVGVREVVGPPGSMFRGATSNTWMIEPDRAAAIRTAIYHASPGDTVVIAGKGHENYQIIGTERRHFDDREVARAALRERGLPVRD
jgi:UDP-N-acetylmuramoyl-L-alanyl-D-glutamate--2,6-diaminopimelate ligase